MGIQFLSQFFCAIIRQAFDDGIHLFAAQSAFENHSRYIRFFPY